MALRILILKRHKTHSTFPTEGACASADPPDRPLPSLSSLSAMKCDGKRPACSQCLHSNRHCEGYPDVLFVPIVPGSGLPTSTTSRPVRPLKRTPKGPARATSTVVSFTTSTTNAGDRNNGSSPSDETISGTLVQRPTKWSYAHPIYPSLSDPLQSRISLIVRNYVPYSEISGDVTNVVPQSPRICGSWVTALPELAAGAIGTLRESLNSAMNALALSIMSYRTGGRLVQPISLAYGETLRLLQRDLRRSGSCYGIERAAAVMCLALVEVLSPTSPDNWLVHMHGVSELIRLSPPELFSSGILHKLFIGIRPLMVIKALVFRKATFLAEEEWTTRPFQSHEPSPLQNLFSLAAAMPEILGKVDALDHESTTAAATAAKRRLAELTEMRASLEAWSFSFQAEPQVPLCWPRAPEDDNRQRNVSSLWFINLSVANVLTHLWSFQIICLSQIRDLLTRFPELGEVESMPENPGRLREVCIELSVSIFQSMEYLMQEEFMLYGPFTAGFPVYTAHKALEMDEKGRTVLQKLDKSVVDRLSIHVILFLQQEFCRQRREVLV
ncbi:Uncharacterized protein Forpe1208_v010831 [Fusarium oxysporum f. sp. rapae]|uniref:Zn(2)-C6 fungal-type domain-containing protein n=1 Tax=Fusarium oxysporum f. sp. rapae TaxID=485398 RepID=A0A8J5TSU6_FUSOX|nr:Uncharacterized protein Forpe1208_v010831 [Fusarium oxysporum f. sp. rapae]